MASFNVIGGMPKSGSTLLCNILNQNPRFYASDTSPVSLGVAGTLHALTSRSEYTSELHKDRDGTRARLAAAARGVVDGWYSHRDEAVIFDKDRSNAWMYQHEVFRVLYPEGIIIGLVRDPREVFARVLAARKADPLVRETAIPAHRMLGAQMETLMGPTGLVGSAMNAIQDLLQRGNTKEHETNFVYLLPYERLVSHPEEALSGLYSALGEEPFEHDLENVVNVAGDLDALYRNQWEHKGEGKVQGKLPSWPDILPPAMAKQILAKYPLFCHAFNYR